MDPNPGIAKLYSVLIAGEYAAHNRLVVESAMAPDVASRIEIGRMAASEMNHYDELADELVKYGVDPLEQVIAHLEVFNRYHRTTNPKTWDEVMVKVYVGDGLAADFYSELADVLPDDARAVVSTVMAETENSAFARQWVRSRVSAEPELRWPLSLWGRRLLGEAITHTQLVLAEEEDVTDLLFADGATDLTKVAQFFDSITECHTRRMSDLGLL